jgi:sodium/potassium-transporting ATPase subunit alpha
MKFSIPSFSSIFKRCFKNKLKELNTVAYDRDYHKMSIEQLESRFNTSSVNGLDQTKAQQLLLKTGKNLLSHKKKNQILKVMGYFFSGFCSLIWVAAIVCILSWKPLGNPDPNPANLGLGVLLVIVILLQAAFTAFQDWSSNKVMQSIKKMMPSSATVIRNGKEKTIAVEELVVGDLVNLSYGSKVPADIRLISSNDLKFDKSMLTGESAAIEGTCEYTNEQYTESKNIAFMTTLITNGQGQGIVIETGNSTCMGSIASLTNQADEKETSLQKELKRFVIIIATSAIIMALIVVVVWAAWLRNSYPNYINVSSLLVNTISVMVAFIPEGLPVCVSLALLLIAKRMAKSRVLVKNLTTIETLSCVNVIASDKTGTLTQNKMFVASAAVGLELIQLEPFVEKNVGFNQLVACSAICNNAKFESKDEIGVLLNNRKVIGDATDTALLRFSTQYEMIKNVKEKYSVLAEIPFNSRNKWMMKIVRKNTFTDIEHKKIFPKDTNMIMLLKGAPDYLLKKCIKIIKSNGDERQLTNQDLLDIIKLQNDLCLDGQRVLLICKKSLESSNFDHSDKSLSTSEVETFVAKTNDFTVVGLVGIIDPPREGIADVIKQCRTAGIRVFMVTGDYALTAAAIALQIGIFTTVHYDTVEEMRLKHKEGGKSYSKGALLVTGVDLQNFTSEDWRKVTPYEQIVFARTSPEQKLRTVKEFQHDDYIVAVTGDGVNDAPALKSANIGIAMGGGSEVAMDAAQLVLLDNNFDSILVAIKNGRLVFANLKKVILYLLPGGCFAELIPVLMSIFLGVQQNLSGFQMLIISLFTDIAPSLSLIMEKPEKDLLKQPPRDRHDHIVDWKFLLQAYAFLGIMISFFSQCMFFWYCQSNGIRIEEILFSFGKSFPNATNPVEMEIYHTGSTVTFISIIYLQIFGNLLSTRTSFKSFFTQSPFKKSTRNLWVFAAEFVSISIMIFTIFVPFFNSFFNTRHVPVQFYFIPLGFCIIMFGADELRKFCVRRKYLYLQKIAW